MHSNLARIRNFEQFFFFPGMYIRSGLYLMTAAIVLYPVINSYQSTTLFNKVITDSGSMSLAKILQVHLVVV